MQTDHNELSLKQRIQWLSERILKLNTIKSDPNEILKHIKLIEDKKAEEWEEQDSQINKRLNNIIDKLYGQHPQILQDVAKDLKIELARPNTSIWKKYIEHIYSDLEITLDPTGKEILDSEQHLMLEDILIKDTKSKWLDNDRRESEKYKNLAKSIVTYFKHCHDQYIKKGKWVENQQLDQ